MFLPLCTAPVWMGYLQLGLVAGLLLPVLGVDTALPQVVFQVEALLLPSAPPPVRFLLVSSLYKIFLESLDQRLRAM